MTVIAALPAFGPGVPGLREEDREAAGDETRGWPEGNPGVI